MLPCKLVVINAPDRDETEAIQIASGGGITLETVDVGADKVTGLTTMGACLV